MDNFLRLNFDILCERVISKGLCNGCAGCVVSCPNEGVLAYENEKPKLIGDCLGCTICVESCPNFYPHHYRVEKFAFGRSRREDEPFGICEGIWAGKTNDADIFELCQDGGVVTAILCWAMEKGYIDGALVSGTGNKGAWVPEPKIVTDRTTLLACAGSRYTYSPNVMGLSQIHNSGIKRLAFVGLPCQISAIRMLQSAQLLLVNPVVLTIGLFCSGCFDYQGLMVEGVSQSLGIPLKELAKMNIKNELIAYTLSGETRRLPLKEIRGYKRLACRPCYDYSAELADMSVGALGMFGTSIVILRNLKSRNFLSEPVAERLLSLKKADSMEGVKEKLKRFSSKKKEKGYL